MKKKTKVKKGTIKAYMWNSAIGCCNLLSFDKGTAEFLAGFGELYEVEIKSFKKIKGSLITPIKCQKN
jgi:hypothetical protein